MIDSVRGTSSTASRSRPMLSPGKVRMLLMMFMPSKSTRLVLPSGSLKVYEVGSSVGEGSDGLQSSTKDTVRGSGDRCPTGL